MSSSSQYAKAIQDLKCDGRDFVVSHWTCKINDTKIPSDGVCNGTADCADGSDEDINLCHGDPSSRLMLFYIIIAYMTLGVLSYLLGKFFIVDISFAFLGLIDLITD